MHWQRSRYLALALLFVFATWYQLRASLETVHVQRSLDFYIPFLPATFTSRVIVNEHAMNWEQGRQEDARAGGYSLLRRGDEILNVNGRAFNGMAVYLQELWAVQHRPPPEFPTLDWKPFTVTVRSTDAKIRNIEFGFPHCTCGIPELWEAFTLWLIAPMFCVLIGFATAARRPSSSLAWAYLGLMLSLSQLQLLDEPNTGFQLTVSLAVWPDWLRVPAICYRSFVQHLWPAAILVASIEVAGFRHRTRWLAAFLVASFLGYATLQASLEIAWSENFRILAPVHRLVEAFRTELIVMSWTGVAVLAVTISPRFGTVVSSIAMAAAGTLYRSPAPIVKGVWINYSNGERWEPVVPKFHHTPELIILTAAFACLTVGVIALRRKLGWQPAAGLLLLLPLAAHAAASFGRYGWYPFDQPFDGWRWLVLTNAAVGLTVIGRWILGATSPSVSAGSLH